MTDWRSTTWHDLLVVERAILERWWEGQIRHGVSGLVRVREERAEDPAAQLDLSDKAREALQEVGKLSATAAQRAADPNDAEEILAKLATVRTALAPTRQEAMEALIPAGDLVIISQEVGWAVTNLAQKWVDQAESDLTPQARGMAARKARALLALGAAILEQPEDFPEAAAILGVDVPE